MPNPLAAFVTKWIAVAAREWCSAIGPSTPFHGLKIIMLQGLSAITPISGIRPCNPGRIQQPRRDHHHFGTGGADVTLVPPETLKKVASRLDGLVKDVLEFSKPAQARTRTSNPGEPKAARTQVDESQTRLSAAGKSMQKPHFSGGSHVPLAQLEKLKDAAETLIQLGDRASKLREPAQPRARTSNQSKLKAADTVNEKEADLSAAVERIKNLKQDYDLLLEKCKTSQALTEAASEGASSSSAPPPRTANRMTQVERAQKIKELKQACKQLTVRCCDQQKLEKFINAIVELIRQYPVSLGDPIPQQALSDAVGKLLDPPTAARRRGRRTGQPAPNELAEGLLVAAERANIKPAVELLSKFIAHAKRHGGTELRNSLVDWIGSGLLGAISSEVSGGRGALDALERSLLVRLTGATFHNSTTRVHHSLLRGAAAGAQGEDRKALSEARDLLASREGWNAHSEVHKDLFHGIAYQVARPDEINKLDKEVAPRLLELYRRQIAELEQESSQRAIPQTYTSPPGQRDDDATSAKRSGWKMEAEKSLQDARQKLTKAEEELPALQEAVEQARARLGELQEQHADDKAGAADAAAAERQRAESLQQVTHESDQVWGDILKSQDILRLFDDRRTLARVVERHVALTPKDMTDRLKQGQTAHVGTFRSPAAFLNALVEMAQTIHGDKDFKFTPGQPILLQLKFPASSGWIRLRDGTDKEVSKSMTVSVTLNALGQITHLHPNVESEDKRQAKRESRGLDVRG